MSKALIIRGGAIGDFILTLPVLQAFRTTLPELRLEVLGYRSVIQLAVEMGLADDGRSIEHGPLAGFFVPGGDLDQSLQDYFAEFSLVVSFLHDPERHFENNVQRCRKGRFVTSSHKVDSENGPAAAQLAQALEESAVFLDAPYVDFGLREEVVDPVIAIHHGSGSPSKNWDAENCVEVCRMLVAQTPERRLLVVSGEAEHATLPGFLQKLERAGVPFEQAEGVPLPELARRLAKCSLFLGHDTGIAHLAGAAGVPSVLLFGPTNPAVWAPQNPTVRVIRNPSQLLERIQPPEVVAAAVDILKLGD